MELHWKAGASILVKAENGAAVVAANREGLLSLAAHLTALAGEEPGAHIHLDDFNSLEDGSAELILERIR